MDVVKNTPYVRWVSCTGIPTIIWWRTKMQTRKIFAHISSVNYLIQKIQQNDLAPVGLISKSMPWNHLVCIILKMDHMIQNGWQMPVLQTKLCDIHFTQANNLSKIKTVPLQSKCVPMVFAKCHGTCFNGVEQLNRLHPLNLFLRITIF